MNRPRVIDIWVVFCSLTLPAMPAAAEKVVAEGSGYFVTRNQQAEIEALAGEKIVINASSYLIGRLQIRADTVERVTITYQKRLKATSEAEASNYADLIKVTLEKAVGELRILLQAPNPAPWDGSDNSGGLEGEVLLPYGSALQINTTYIDLKIEGPFAEVTNRSGFGKIELSDIDGRIDMSTSGQDIIARNIRGKISLNTSNADIRVDSLVSGKEAAQLRNENGNVLINRLRGALEIDDSYGKIKLDNIILSEGASRINASYSPTRISLNQIDRASLNVTSSNSDIELYFPQSSSSAVALEVDSEGDIDVEDLVMKPTRISRSRLEFRVGTGVSRIALNVSRNGSILVRGIKPEKP